MIGKLLTKRQSRTNLLSSTATTTTDNNSSPSSPHSNEHHHHHSIENNSSLDLSSSSLAQPTFVNLNSSNYNNSLKEEKQLRIQKLKVQYPKLFEEIYEEEDEADICPICLELYTTDNPQLLCKCSHGFHFQCSEEWRMRSNECPVCFRKLIYMYEDEELPPIEKNRNEKKQNPTIMMMREPLYYSSGGGEVLDQSSSRSQRRGFFGSILSKYVIFV